MGVAGEGVQNKNRVVPSFVKSPPRLVANVHLWKHGTVFEGEITDLHLPQVPLSAGILQLRQIGGVYGIFRHVFSWVTGSFGNGRRETDTATGHLLCSPVAAVQVRRSESQSPVQDLQ